MLHLLVYKKVKHSKDCMQYKKGYSNVRQSNKRFQNLEKRKDKSSFSPRKVIR